MELTFLGSGPDQPIPRAGHRDPVCRAARSNARSRRNNSAAILKQAKTLVLIDCGPTVAQQLSSSVVKHLSALLITHAHRDAIGGLNWLALRRDRPLLVFADVRTAKKIRDSAALRHIYDVTLVHPFRRFSVKQLSVLPVPVTH
ncbi:MAG: MBL fold metallo-hydrolase, partial [Parcubacteria group bacterium]